MEKIKMKNDLLKVKNLIHMARAPIRDFEEEFLTQLKTLGHRIDEIERKLKGRESVSILKKKNIILNLLKSAEMTSSAIARKIGISRSRVVQYLKMLENDNLVKGKLVGREKYYSAVKHE